MALRVSSSVPQDGATGVRRDTSLSIVFSEPMDKASVEAAFVSDSLPSEPRELHWDATGTVLNVVLGAPLSYATGTDPSQLPALRYEYRLSASARDLAGNPLPETSVSFSTLREIRSSSSAQSDPQLTGNWRSDGVYGTGSCAPEGANICVGDSNFGSNARYRGFVSFDSSAMPASVVEVIQADLSIEVEALLGDPFGDLGELTLERLTFAAIGPDSFGAEALASLGGVASARAGDILTFDMLALLPPDLVSSVKSQYRLRFQTDSDNDSATDLLFLGRSSVALRVAYLVP